MKAPRYPLTALIKELRAVSEERSNTPKDDAIVASVLEATSSLAASGLCVYQKPEGGTEPLSSIGALLASSGAGKTHHHKQLTGVITRWCPTYSEKKIVNQHELEAARYTWRQKAAKIKKAIQECITEGRDTEKIETLLAEILAQEPRHPIKHALLHNDATVSAILLSLEYWDVSAWIEDEGAVALNMLRSKDFSTLANLSSGKMIVHSRVGEPRREIQGYLTMLFMVQHGLFKEFYKKRGYAMKASGFEARVLYYIVPDEWIGSEDPDHAIIGPAHERYEARITEMLDEIDRRIRSGRTGLPSVAFCDDAKAVLRRYQHRHLDMMAQPEFAYYRDFLAKLTGHIARMAAKNHVFLGREGDVSAELVEMAEQVCWYHFETYQWMHNPLEQEPRKVQDAATLVQWMLDHRERQFAYSQISKVAMV